MELKLYQYILEILGKYMQVLYFTHILKAGISQFIFVFSWVSPTDLIAVKLYPQSVGGCSLDQTYFCIMFIKICF